MLNVFVSGPQGLARIELAGGLNIPHDALWLDLFEPTIAEERAVEAALGIEVPTREEMKEIETSNRLYEEGGAIYMTATVGTKLDSEQPETTAVTFILTDGRLVTNRYADPKPFQRFVAYAQRQSTAFHTAPALLTAVTATITCWPLTNVLRSACVSVVVRART